MPHAGMVHALEEVRRVLRDGGQLIDVRPIVCHPPVAVLDREGERHAGRLDDSSDLPDQQACDRALQQAIEHRWFERLAADQFSYSMYWDTPQEMLEYLAENWEGVLVPEDVVVRMQRQADLAAPPAEVRVRLTMAIAVLDRLDAGRLPGQEAGPRAAITLS